MNAPNDVKMYLLAVIFFAFLSLSPSLSFGSVFSCFGLTKSSTLINFLFFEWCFFYLQEFPLFLECLERPFFLCSIYMSPWSNFFSFLSRKHHHRGSLLNLTRSIIHKVQTIQLFFYSLRLLLASQIWNILIFRHFDTKLNEISWRSPKFSLYFPLSFLCLHHKSCLFCQAVSTHTLTSKFTYNHLKTCKTHKDLVKRTVLNATKLRAKINRCAFKTLFECWDWIYRCVFPNGRKTLSIGFMT